MPCPQPASARPVNTTYRQDAKRCRHDTRPRCRGAQHMRAAGTGWLGRRSTGLDSAKGCACAYTPVNKLRGGGIGEGPREWQISNLTCRKSGLRRCNQRRRAVLCVAMPAPIPCTAADTHAGGRGRVVSAVSIVAHRGLNEAPSWRWWLATGLELRQTWADGTLRLGLLFGERSMAVCDEREFVTLSARRRAKESMLCTRLGRM